QAAVQGPSCPRPTTGRTSIRGELPSDRSCCSFLRPRYLQPSPRGGLRGDAEVPAEVTLQPSTRRGGHRAERPGFDIPVLYVVGDAIGEDMVHPHLPDAEAGEHPGDVGGPYLPRSEEHTSELQSPCNLVCRLLLEKKKKKQ